MILIEKLSKAEANCPNFHDHTPCPDGYLQWHAWARKMKRTHRQVKCTGCSRYTIWIPRRNRYGLFTNRTHGENDGGSN